ncbi:hypothetical protein QAD02_016735 [Eretmocerus hayati]|uniref:Uncharacterized protein n=1 Tax=Eretmocerus hayati TaxID=131215 RepID=A0ACC2PBW9_9HYME|nr:hypothetical protein QAD02_016735 [Eretmocerus hayati]
MGVAQDESFTRALSSSWWLGEAEQVFQKIERWAAFARGYNRLRPTGTETRPSTSNKSSNSGPMAWCSMSNLSSGKNGQVRNKQVSEKSRLGCCGTKFHTYRSNGNFDNGNPLEVYSLDHSMYFKTIGEIRNSKCSSGHNNINNENNNNNASTEDVSIESNSNTLPLDCGDFLSTDFEEDDFVIDEEDDKDMREVDAREYDLAEQLKMLRDAYEAAKFYGSEEDRINNNDGDEVFEDLVDRRGSCSSSARASREGLASLLGLAH